MIQTNVKRKADLSVADLAAYSLMAMRDARNRAKVGPEC
jgi:hypothetical protein